MTALSGNPPPPGDEPQPGPADITEDRLLGGRVRLRQPASGYRAAIDPIFLAASIPAEPGQLVLDVGCGSGPALLCLAARLPQIRAAGLEMQRDLVRLAGDNVILNGMEGRISVTLGDLLHPPPRLSPGSFDHVMANPPYLPRGAGTPAATAGKAAATMEGEADLAAWVRFCLSMVRAKGSVTLIHRADRLDVLISSIGRMAGEIVIFPLWPGDGKPAGRVLLRMRKQVAAPARLAAGMILHGPDGRFTEAADSVLREGRALTL